MTETYFFISEKVIELHELATSVLLSHSTSESLFFLKKKRNDLHFAPEMRL